MNRQQQSPRLAITLGDPTGIGPEVILKALADPRGVGEAKITIIGSRSLLQTCYTHLRQTLDEGEVLADLDQLSILDIELDTSAERQIIPGVGNAVSGAASFAYLETAIAHTLAGEFDGIVTAPIAKSLWKAAGYDYPGQTEVLAKYSGVERFGMLFVARSPHTGWLLRTLLATTHIPLCQVSNTLTPELMRSKLDLLLDCLRVDFGLGTPRIAISGLNPHSGEQGQLGREEQEWLIPWLEQQRQHRPEVKLDGPVPPDTLWVNAGQAWYGNRLIPNLPDAYLALYHDQGLIPVKLMAFDRAINTTIGLPFVRTSPDHGTAFDIAGRGIANASSMKAAIQLAIELVQHRKI
ncbi:MAG TPA: 4-hydroxythreonine-4-phosphate dehydrogenase PdxA [Cyanobacteria bacterium UBA12227]|nr:4-hydroxythreonine-4-phosphate dehydrogenase PdxA [Cyanobacteria bacterium UBA12227]HAX90333.1 4-hydroxythreonine-4-phosphate dehydrogenase PdxA [Cyanobacteria bacterium UBA11370]HBY78664.1 4-hydroxythreonine-4-phosphate dehydrogenase PdxA [Cyanobacteria bacterium UBA11148]